MPVVRKLHKLFFFCYNGERPYAIHTFIYISMFPFCAERKRDETLSKDHEFREKKRKMEGRKEGFPKCMEKYSLV